MGVIDRAILQDEIRQALNGLFLNGQAGRKETKRISYNSDTDAKEIIPYGNQYYARVLDEPIPLTQENFKRVVVSMSIANLEPAVSVGSKADGTAFVERVAEMGGAICVFIMIGGNISDYPAIAVFEQDLPAELTGVAIKKGVYFISETEPEAKVETILEYETIHPIDQKFLPGVCLPVVDLTGCAVGKEITDEAINATLTKLAATGMPIIGITYASGDGKVSEVFANAAFGVAFIGSTTKCQITNPSATGTNGWVLGASE